jgi:UDP-N-acetylglucosamine 2-epimerase (non-hydrolysing)
LNEGVDSNSILVTGNTVIDALLWTRETVMSFSNKVDPKLVSFLGRFPQFILVTGHRRENFGDGFLAICKALKRLAEAHPNMGIVYPVHLNPNVLQPVSEMLGGVDNICLTHPLDYPDFIFCMDQSWAILTDSGGVQEEAPSLGKPVLVMRDTTERPEALEAGTVQLVGAVEETIVGGIQRLVHQPNEYERMQMAHNPYGDGKASRRILDHLKTAL